ncbi:TetR family transcriptional regulator [Flavilitoribacter nigricans DSM 23189 = NBRC 102662]|uniref:TetR family transcriptional regulator n=1 Tax=Flavilitoribacter nigricans (strain ATCC 23147 / DSM 23189 / NBRC 102662 / NCIMB 1420 / SS-2) TaxID=1122177 RepID=A0A2D0NHZ2_FLAN2|nr:TetR family transcriptional regulator [Flavilitoribacter nigricans DSM 23189 = NBRC 102662]
MAVAIQIRPNQRLYLRDPQDTKLGRNIIKHGILLVDEIGFEQFTFKKLAERIQSTEASVYRYFENKHNLLTYLVAWYWEWVSFQIDFHIMNISDPEQKLRIAIQSLVEASMENPAVDFVNESVLHRVVIDEGTKVYRTKQVDEENKDGFFIKYKALVKKVADLILEVNPKFPYPFALASTLFEMANDHVYFAQHLPQLTDIKINGENLSEVREMIDFMVFKLVK